MAESWHIYWIGPIRQYLLILAVVAGTVFPTAGSAQVPPRPSGADRFETGLKTIRAREPRTERELYSFIDSLASNTAAFEVIVGQGRLLTLKQDIAVAGQPSPVIATGDPSVIDFEIIGARHVRITGIRIGTTDLSIVASDRESYDFEVRVVADLEILRARLRQLFPDAILRLVQLRDHVVVEGQARSTRQVAQILTTIETYLLSVQVGQLTKTKSRQRPGAAETGAPANETPPPESEKPSIEAKVPPAKIINLIRVPGPQQVMLNVQVAELNRTALRELGVSFLFQDGSTALGSNMGRGIPSVQAGGDIVGFARLLNPLASSSTFFGVMKSGNFNYFVNALRENQVLKVLAEPNLVAMHGEQADFLAGGQFPVIVPQASAGSTGTFTTEFRDFGVAVKFIPFIVDHDTIRLAVNAEVSELDFSIAATLAEGASPTPGTNNRKANTVVELRHGQTLAIAGLLQVSLAGNTSRIPGMGDLPYIGAMFSNNATRRVEKELLILVTPRLVQPFEADEFTPLPGDNVGEPNDREFYLKGRIESREGPAFRSTTSWYDPLGLEQKLKTKRHSPEACKASPVMPDRLDLQTQYISGRHGYSE